jgi:hypothetical protein
VIEQQRAIRRNQPDNPDQTDEKMVDVVICNLRKRLRSYWPAGHEVIKTLWGHGYFVEKADRELALDKIHAIVQAVPHEFDQMCGRLESISGIHASMKANLLTAEKLQEAVSVVTGHADTCRKSLIRDMALLMQCPEDEDAAH